MNAQVNPFAPTNQQQLAAGAAVATATPTPTAAAANPGTAITTAPAGGSMPMQMVPPAGNNSSTVPEDVSLDDDIKFHTLEKFPKMKLNEVARIALIVFDVQPGKAPAPKLKKVDYFYDKQRNAIWNVPKNPDVLRACVTKYGEPKIKFGAIVIKYNTDMYGNVLPDAKYDLLAYTFGKDKWPTLKQLHAMWGLQAHDLVLTCREVEFQKIDIQPAPDCLFRANPQFAAEVTEKALLLHEKFLGPLLGRVLSDAEIMAHVNGMPLPGQPGAGGPAAGMPAGGAVNPFAAGAGTGAPASAAFAVPAGQPAVAGANFADLVANGTNAPA